MKKYEMGKNLMTAEERYKFLFRVTNKLTQSPNKTISVQEVTKLIVPQLADYCRLAMIDENDNIVEVAVNHTNPNKVSLASELFSQYKDDPNSTMGVPVILKTGKPEIIHEFNDEYIAKLNINPLVLKTVKELGLTSYMGVPLIARDKIVGALTFSSIKRERLYTETDLKFAGHIARRIAFALDSSRLFKAAQDELHERKQYEKQLRFLAEASKILSSSLDYNTTLSNVAKLAIENLADWCAIDMMVNGQIKNVTIMHKDPKKIEFAKLIRKKQPPTDPNSGVLKVFNTGMPQLYPIISPELIKSTVKDAKTMRIFKKIGLHSIMLIPIIISNETVGVITFISSSPKYQYDQSDVYVAEEVASRAALAIQNSKLYSNSLEAVRLRDDFISIASHELKTPVTSLKMHTQLLQKMMSPNIDPVFSAALKKMDSQINKLTDLITDLLDVSRIQQGKLQFKEEPFNLNETVREMVDNVQPLSNQHQITIEGKIRRKVIGDSDRIGQVVVNLLTNAVKYSPKAKKVIVRLVENKRGAKVIVKDYGIGIKKNYQNKIFRLFYRVSSPEAITYPGLGVGLYISNEIVKRHSGNFYVKSSYGKGSEFIFTLPYDGKRVAKLDR
jgi:signal transduction histidine kinase